MERSASFALSYLVPKFYEKNMENVIILFCEKLPPVVLLAKKRHFAVEKRRELLYAINNEGNILYRSSGAGENAKERQEKATAFL
jgi:hypothetical protein